MASIGALQNQNPQPNSIRPRWKTMAASSPIVVFVSPGQDQQADGQLQSGQQQPEQRRVGHEDRQPCLLDEQDERGIGKVPVGLGPGHHDGDMDHGTASEHRADGQASCPCHPAGWRLRHQGRGRPGCGLCCHHARPPFGPTPSVPCFKVRPKGSRHGRGGRPHLVGTSALPLAATARWRSRLRAGCCSSAAALSASVSARRRVAAAAPAAAPPPAGGPGHFASYADSTVWATIKLPCLCWPPAEGVVRC